MKSLLALIAVACLAGTAFAQQSNPPQPNLENQKLAIWHGEWTYEGTTHTTVLGSGYKSAGRMTGRPVQNGFASEFLYVEKGSAGETRYLEIDFWDPAIKRYAYIYLGNDGYVERGSFAMKGNVTTYEGAFTAEGRPYKVRGVETVAPDGQSFTKQIELSADGNTWVPFSTSKYLKVKTAAK
jgi:hypothetical protein